jgi:dehydrogenase/reductase SDR family protein 1
MKTLEGKVALVTGGSRGVGKGVALALGSAGATVYITGRAATAETPTTALGVALPGSVAETAEEVTRRGGKGIAMGCDHRDDAQVRAVFDAITEREGRLDLLVNNAYQWHESIPEDRCFWDTPLEAWDNQQMVGLRSHYVAAVYAAQMMVPAKRGLIVNISSPVAGGYVLGVAYGVIKAALDRMSADMAHELRPHNVGSLSLWPGPIGTEKGRVIAEKKNLPLHSGTDESPEHVGRAVAALAADPKVMEKSGQVLITADLGQEYGFTDIDGKTPLNPRDILWPPPPPPVYKGPKRQP